MEEIRQQFEQMCSERNLILLSFIPNCTKVFIKIGAKDKHDFIKSSERNVSMTKLVEMPEFYFNNFAKHLSRDTSRDSEGASEEALKQFLHSKSFQDEP